MDASSFIHPPPFYDRFDICFYLRSLTLSEKFQLQEILEKYDWDLIGSMSQILSFDELEEVRKEVAAQELDPTLVGNINLLIRDFQACIRDKEESEVKPPSLCEGCHFLRDICSSIREPLSERATVAITHLVKATQWLKGSCDFEEVLRMALVVLPHRITLVRTRNVLSDLSDLLGRERIKMADRNARKQWSLLNELLKDFNRPVYKLAREAAVEDVAFAEELVSLEEKWVSKDLLKIDESLTSQMGWKRQAYKGVAF
jgi:MoxR-like ATPase